MIKNILIAFLAIILIGCTASQKKTVNLGDLKGTWQLQTLNGDRINNAKPLTLEFTNDNKVFGHAGCNRVMGEFSIQDDSRISLSDLGTTRMMCSQPEMDLENKYIKALNNVHTTSFETGVLSFLNSDNEVIATFIKNNGANIIGKSWKLDELNGRNVSSEKPLTLEINGDNNISGFAGCNRLTGKLDVLNGDNVRFSNFGITKMMCSQTEMDLEQNYVDALEKTSHSTVQDGNLVLMDKDNKIVAKFSENIESPIINKYWKLVKLDGKEISMGENQEKEQYLMLKNDGTITGFAGCNTFNGEYKLEENSKRLKIKDNIAVTLRTCPDVNVDEAEFLKVLSLTDNYTIDGDKLYLNIGRRAPLAVFEAIYF